MGQQTLQSWALSQLDGLRAQGLERHLEPLRSGQGSTVRVGDETLINFSSNDYLGLASSPLLVEALSAAAKSHGVGSGASRLVAGDSPWHQTLETELARFLKTEAALLFNSGYAANVGLISALWGKGDTLFCDALNHASLIDGCRLSRANVVIYPHGDVETLERRMAEPHDGRRAVITDAVFSMDGDTAPLVELAALCKRTGAALVVDEAHATGVFGRHGEGLCEALGVEPDLRMGTLGKSLGVFGAYVASSEAVCKLLFHRARSLVFSTSMPASLCAAASSALKILSGEEGTALRHQLWRNIETFSTGLKQRGFEAEPRSPIFSVVLGTPARAVEASAFLRARGVWARPIRPPTVAPGTSRLRMVLRADHTDDHLAQALDALRQWRKAES